MLPRLIRGNVEISKEGDAIETEQFYGPDRKEEITIRKKHQIGANGRVLSAVRSVRVGDTDLTPEIRSGKRTELAADGRMLRFTVVPDPSGAKDKAVVIVSGDN